MGFPFFYDYRGRLIQTVEKNHLGGQSVYSTKYDFPGNILASHERHQTSSTAAADVKQSNFSYDFRGRLKTETTTLNGGTAATMTYAYNDLGQLQTRTYGSVAENIAYNIQGWQTSRSSSLFESQLRYFDPRSGSSKARYSGDVAEMRWKQYGQSQAGRYGE